MTENDRYQHGKIYAIKNTVNDIQYIGSTCNKLPERWTQHKRHANEKNYNGYNMPLYKAIRELGKENFFIELVENIPCNSKIELRVKEGSCIKKVGIENTYNARIAGRSETEWKKIYHHDHKEKRNEYSKWYWKNYRSKGVKMSKTNCQNSLQCLECLGFYTKQHKSRHLASQKHNNCLQVQIKKTIKEWTNIIGKEKEILNKDIEYVNNLQNY